MRQLDLFESRGKSTFKNFTIYRSSAGSGKTFTLVKEYLKIVLRNPQDYQHILAITFTNKATEEMKTRILKELWDMADGNPTDMKAVIQQEFRHFEQKLNIQDRAQKALTNILHNYSKFSVCTIDHFFSQLVRSLARELKLNLNYQIDVDDDTAMEQSIRLLYDSLGTDPDLQNWTKDFAFSRIDQDKGWQLDYTLADFGKELFKEKFHKGFSKLDPELVNLKSLRELEKQLQNTREIFEKIQRAKAREALDIISGYGLKGYDFKFKGSGTISVFYNFLKGKFALGKRFLDVAQGYDDWYKGDSIKVTLIKGAAEAGLDHIVQEIFQYYQSHYRAYVSATELHKHIYSYGLLEAISDKLRVYRHTNNLMLLSHNSFLLREIISDQEAPFLFEKLGAHYKHILIDEFQDTSAYQWENLKPLVTNSLDQAEEGHHVLLVGDVKQSIYRWRGGDLNLLLQKAVDDLELYRELLQENTLQKNYRSAQSVVHFNNRFFEIASQLLLQTDGFPEDSSMLSEVYREIEQLSTSKLTGGVSIQFFENDNGNWKSKAMNTVLSVIRDHINQGGNYQEILILCYKNSEVAEISAQLSFLGMPVDSEQALNLAGNWAVRMVISSMRLLVDPRDTLARAEMAYLYQKGNGVESDFGELFAQATEINSGLLAAYLPHELVDQWEGLAHLNVYEWVSRLIPLLITSVQPDPFLSRFLEICLEQNARGRVTGIDFLNWWEEKKDQQMVIFPSHQQAIRVMTIHKAKGLEAPLVIMPWTDFELKPRQDTLYWTDQLPGPYKKYKLLPLSFTSDLLLSHFSASYQQELLEGLIEGLNTMYVAFTRARQRLYVCASQPSTAKRDDLGVAHKLLWEVCNQPHWGDHWNLPLKNLTLGDFAESVVPDKEESKPTISLEELMISPYQELTTIRSGAYRMFTLLDHYKSRPIREGIQIHEVLASLKDCGDLPRVIAQLISEGIVAEEQKDQIIKKVRDLLEIPECRRFFDPHWTVFSERKIASGGQWYQPDRVLTSEEATLVIDFKREKEDMKHYQQVNQYADLLEQMGRRNIKKYLVYVNDLRIVEW